MQASLLQKLKTWLSYQNIFIFGMCLIAVGLSISPALMSIGQGVLLLNFLASPNIKERAKLLVKSKVFLSFLGIYTLYTIGLIHTHDMHNGIAVIRRLLPIIIIPLAATAIPSFNPKEYATLLWTFTTALIVSTLVSVWVLRYYHFYNGDPRNISVFIFQIRFGLMISLAICLLAGHLWQNLKSLSLISKLIHVLAILWLLIFLGILGNRSAMLGLLAVMGAVGAYYVFSKGKVLLPLGIGMVTLGLFVVLYYTAPGIRQRIDEVKYEYELMQNGESANGHSILQRFVYWQIALDIIQKNPIIGIGTGDIDETYEAYYATKYTSFDKQAQLQTHNQFLSIGIMHGLAGLAVFIALLFYPMFTNKNIINYPYVAFFIIFICSCLVDDTLKSQAGATFFGFFSAFAFLSIKTLSPHKKNKIV